ncbi:hypothetical protein P8452_50120 [Trifolium repens]|nr:hypothetical protein P8452_50120 [Trifolium repens]
MYSKRKIITKQSSEPTQQNVVSQARKHATVNPTIVNIQIRLNSTARRKIKICPVITPELVVAAVNSGSNWL